MSAPWVVLTVVLALIVSVPGGWLLTAGVLRLADRSSGGNHGQDDVAGARPGSDAGEAAPEHAGEPAGADEGRAARNPGVTGGGSPAADGAARTHGPHAAAAGTGAVPATGADGGRGPGRGPGPGHDTGGPDGLAARTALRGGTWIGILERLAVTGCIVAGEPGGVAVVVAIKGLGRYPELKANPGASERFVIGTLASLLWSAAVGTLGRALILG